MEWISYGILIVLLLSFLGMFLSFVLRKRSGQPSQNGASSQSQSAEPLTVVGASVQTKEEADGQFTLVFVTDDGQQKTLQVERSVFDALQVGDSGALALHGDGYFDFQKANPQNQE